jgi:hypothetical protein
MYQFKSTKTTLYRCDTTTGDVDYEYDGCWYKVDWPGTIEFEEDFDNPITTADNVIHLDD